jgi:hypothetical protein
MLNFRELCRSQEIFNWEPAYRLIPSIPSYRAKLGANWHRATSVENARPDAHGANAWMRLRPVSYVGCKLARMSELWPPRRFGIV